MDDKISVIAVFELKKFFAVVLAFISVDFLLLTECNHQQEYC